MVGLLVNVQEKFLINKPDRMWRLRSAVISSRRQGKSTSLAMQILCGHVVNACLVCPGLLSVVSECFRIAFAESTIVTTFSLEICLELRLVAALLPFLLIDIGRETHPFVYCSDSSLRGFAVHKLYYGTSASRQLACHVERWGFKDGRPGPASGLSVQSANFVSARSAFAEWAQSQVDADGE